MQTIDLAAALRGNSYPGRGLIVGRSADNRQAIIAYFIMGRSENSRNRVFTATDDGIRTEAFDPSKLVDPSLIIYHPVRVLNGTTIVTNGDQTDTIRDALAGGRTYIDALRTRCFEPDPPNFTPRISAVLCPDGGYGLSILKRFGTQEPVCNARQFFEYDHPAAGVGHFLHTYVSDGNPLPSFAGEPEVVALEAPSARELANLLWENLNPDNKVSLFVRYITLDTGDMQDVILNVHSH